MPTWRQATLFPEERQRKLPPAIERRTHIAIADLLARVRASGWLYLHIPNGELRSKETARLLKRMGVMAGACDFLLIGPDGKHHWLELKRGRAPLSAAQEEFLEALRARGVAHAVARSFEDAVAVLRCWGALRPFAVQ